MNEFLERVGFSLNYTSEFIVISLILARTMPMIALTPFLAGKIAPFEIKMGLGAIPRRAERLQRGKEREPGTKARVGFRSASTRRRPGAIGRGPRAGAIGYSGRDAECGGQGGAGDIVNLFRIHNAPVRRWP